MVPLAARAAVHYFDAVTLCEGTQDLRLRDDEVRRR